MSQLLRISGINWRMKFLSEADDILQPVHSPEGQSHYAGQRTIYLSETPEGCEIATKIYWRGDDAPRGIFPLMIKDANIVDLRDIEAIEALEIDPTHRQADWQKIRKQGLPSPTWKISDRVRALGLDGMQYESRTKPSLTHLTLFRWNQPDAPNLVRAGEPIPASNP